MLLRQLLLGINHCHGNGIIHRDIKPGNVIINPRKMQLKLIDLGLAEFYHPEKSYSTRVATRSYKAPELLLEYPYYDYSLDIWAFGVILGEMITNRQPFFSTPKKFDNLFPEIVKLLGKDDLKCYLEKYKIPVNDICKTVLKDKSISDQRKPLRTYIRSPEFECLFDILEMCLVYDQNLRPTAAELLSLSVFQPKK